MKKRVKKSKSRDAGFKHPVIDGITFASGTEGDVYVVLKKAGFKPKYEELKVTLVDGFKPTMPFFIKPKKGHVLKLDMRKFVNTTYTPDFTFNYKNYLIIVEVKGVVYEDYAIKRKLFRQYLETGELGKVIFFEVYSVENALQMIEIIKGL